MIPTFPGYYWNVELHNCGNDGWKDTQILLYFNVCLRNQKDKKSKSKLLFIKTVLHQLISILFATTHLYLHVH